MLTPLVYVYLGKNLPEYIYHSLNFSVKNKNLVYLLTNCTNIDSSLCEFNIINTNLFYNQNDFKIYEKNFKLNRQFRDGFWLKTYERFFVLLSWMKANNLSNIYHAECDNLVFNLSDLDKILDSIGLGLFIPRDSSNRVIASLIYINDVYELSNLCNFFINNQMLKNEMHAISDYSANSKKVHNLPTDSAFYQKSEWDYINPKITMGIFDAAAIGQYLFGIDGRNKIGLLKNRFINENVKYDINDAKFTYNNGYLKMKINCEYKFYNLHIHSKMHKKILKYGISYFLNKKVLLSINLVNTLKIILYRVISLTREK